MQGATACPDFPYVRMGEAREQQVAKELLAFLKTNEKAHKDKMQQVVVEWCEVRSTIQLYDLSSHSVKLSLPFPNKMLVALEMDGKQVTVTDPCDDPTGYTSLEYRIYTIAHLLTKVYVIAKDDGKDAVDIAIVDQWDRPDYDSTPHYSSGHIYSGPHPILQMN